MELDEQHICALTPRYNLSQEPACIVNVWSWCVKIQILQAKYSTSVEYRDLGHIGLAQLREADPHFARYDTRGDGT